MQKVIEVRFSDTQLHLIVSALLDYRGPVSVKQAKALAEVVKHELELARILSFDS